LMGRFLVVPPSRDDRFNPPLSQAGAQGVAVIAPIGNQPLGPFPGSPEFARPPDGNGGEGLLAEGDLRRGRPVQGWPNGVPAPSTRTIHFVPLPRLVLPTLRPLFSPGRSCHRQSIRPSAVSAGR
jgi:hypothetical protein